MKKITNLALVITTLLFTSCMGEVKEKLQGAKKTVSNTASIVDEASSMVEQMEMLKNLVPLTNENLKTWLPEDLDGMKRTRFKVGASGMANVRSVEGTYKENDARKGLTILVMDGAGEAGSVMVMSFGMFGKMEMEMEDERKHQQTVEVDGIRAQQTYYKKNNRTKLMFVFKERFMVSIDGTDMTTDETWELTKKLDFAKLIDLAE